MPIECGCLFVRAIESQQSDKQMALLIVSEGTGIRIDDPRMLSCQVWKRSKISIRDNMPKINTSLLLKN